MTLREAIEMALSLFQKKPHADVGEIRQELTAAGIDADLAAKLVCFIPIALCRRVFGAVGVQFSLHYITLDDAGNETGEASFLDDPAYVEVYDFCTALLAPGQQAEPYRPLAARSPDYRAIMEMHLQQGVALNRMSLPPPRLSLPPGEAAAPTSSPQESRQAGASTEPTAPQMPAEAQAYMDTVQAHFDRPFVRQFFYEVTVMEWNVPQQGAVSFWAIQFRDQANGALVWTDSSGQWRVGKWIRFAGKEIPLPIDLCYCQDCPSAASFADAIVLLEAGQEQQPAEKRPWYNRLWKRPG